MLALRHLPLPRIGAHDVLIRVEATTVSAGDRRLRASDARQAWGSSGGPSAASHACRPVLGTELTGIVAAIGSAVTRFAPGDAVIAFPGAAVGGHAEYCRFSETGMIVPRPAGLPIETAAALGFGGTTAPVSRGRWARRLVMPVHYAPAAGCLSAARCMARNGPKCSWSGRDGLRARP